MFTVLAIPTRACHAPCVNAWPSHALVWVCVHAGTGQHHHVFMHDHHTRLCVYVWMQVLGNITIGSGSMIGAGSLVLKPVAPRAMVAGSPAKEVGKVCY
jgi:hypothetical protein